MPPFAFSKILEFIGIRGGIAIAFLLCLPVSYCQGYSDGREAQREDYRAAERAAEKKQAESAGEAADERDTDEQRTTEAQEARDNAINETDDVAPSDASNALNCERLRAAGTSVQHIPACRGREGQAKTNPRP